MKERIVLLIVLIVLLIFMTGCEPSRKCIKSHVELSTCVRPIYTGKTVTTVVVPCNVTVCDEYEEIEEEPDGNN